MVGLESSNTMETTEQQSGAQNEFSSHQLQNSWNLWGHLPHDSDWSMESYINIGSFKTVEEVIMLCELLPEKLIKNSMLFLMKEDIKPTWEDKENINGGCFSFKVMNKHVCEIWKKTIYCLIGNSFSNNKPFVDNITGVTISPKKNFCIIKIWTANCNEQSPTIMKTGLIKGLNVNGCMFKKHISEN